jgi:hypothetical protein
LRAVLLVDTKGCRSLRVPAVRLSALRLARIAATWNLAVWKEIPNRRAIVL